MFQETGGNIQIKLKPKVIRFNRQLTFGNWDLFPVLTAEPGGSMVGRRVKFCLRLSTKA